MSEIPEDDYFAPCEQCDGDAAPLGALGRLMHYRCLCCGWMFAVKLEAVEA